jgi:broad specificity phosphatase PhoE
VEQFSNLNPLDKGDFNGLELDQIQDIEPDWYAALEKDPFHTR